MHRFVDVFDATTGALAAQASLRAGLPEQERSGHLQSHAPRSSPASPRLPLPQHHPLQLGSEFMTAIPSRNVTHPVLPVLAAATNSGRIHIYRT